LWTKGGRAKKKGGKRRNKWIEGDVAGGTANESRTSCIRTRREPSQQSSKDAVEKRGKGRGKGGKECELRARFPGENEVGKAGRVIGLNYLDQVWEVLALRTRS